MNCSSGPNSRGRPTCLGRYHRLMIYVPLWNACALALQGSASTSLLSANGSSISKGEPIPSFQQSLGWLVILVCWSKCGQSLFDKALTQKVSYWTYKKPLLPFGTTDQHSPEGTFYTISCIRSDIKHGNHVDLTHKDPGLTIPLDYEDYAATQM